MKRETYDRHRWWIDPVIKYNILFLGKRLIRSVYDRHFFEHANVEKIRSSEKVAEIINEHFDFQSVLDIGCGMGLYSGELVRFGKEVFGCDSSADGIAMAPEELFVFHADVTQPLRINRSFDLVMCFEVAEHLQRRDSGRLVSNCAGSARGTILFTAAPRGQGGVGHINEQPPSFWIGLFERNGFFLDEKCSNIVRKAMADAQVVSWITNNLMVFRRSSTSD